MNFLNLNYFYVCAEERNFTRASKRLFISQQSLSSHIKKLEEEYGVTLFNRGPQITLTEAGECLYRNAKDILLLHERAERELSDIKNFRQGEIFLGVAPSRGTAMLPALLGRYHKEFPQVRIHLFEGGNEEIVAALNKGEIDLAIGFEMQADGVVADVLFHEDQYIVVPKTIFQAFFTAEEQRALLEQEHHSIKTFAHLPFLMAQTNTWTGRVIKRLTEQENIQLNIVATTLNTQTILKLAMEGIGICLCSGTFIVEEMSREASPILCFPIEDLEARGAISICTMKNHYQTRATREFIRITKELFAEEDN